MKNITQRLRNHYKRIMSSYFSKHMCKIKNSEPIISFAFDDFPRTSYLVGGSILNKYRFKATYYVSFGLMGKNLPVGEAFVQDDIVNLLKDGHELGCHTYDHYESWETSVDVFNKSIIANRNALKSKFPDVEFRSFSYPKTNPHPKIKVIANKYFDTCRGGDQNYNSLQVDLNLLKSYFIDKKNRENLIELKSLINKTIKKKHG